MSYDAIVIGAGTNGLVAAHVLARAGRRVVVLEQQTSPAADFDAGWVPPAVIDKLAIAVQTATPDPWISIPQQDGTRLDLFRDVARSAESIRRVAPADAAKWPEFCTRMRRLAGVLEALYTQPAPDVETTQPGELLRLALLGIKVRGLGSEAIIDLLRILPMPVSELLDEWFENDSLKAAIGAAGVLHLHQGPRSGGTAFMMLHHHVGSPAGVFRLPMTNLGRVLEGLTGVELRRGARVERIAVSGGLATGVILASGDVIAAPLVVSSADPRRTLLDLLEPGWLDPEFALAVRNIKCRGVAARVTLHCGKAPGFGTLTLAPSLTYLEKAYDDVKYGRISTQPFLEARTIGNQVEVHVQYVPVAPKDGAWDETRRRAFGEDVAKRLTAAAPELQGAISSIEVHSPADIERESGQTGGHRYHGEHTLDQILFMRPVPGWSRYRMPIGGLYLCGAGTHPGGGIAGGSGLLAAQAILKGG